MASHVYRIKFVFLLLICLCQFNFRPAKEPRIEEGKILFSCTNYISIKLLFKKRRKRNNAEAHGWLPSFLLPQHFGFFFTWWRSIAVPGHAHIGGASWSAHRWGLGPLSCLVAHRTQAAAARWPEKERPCTWPGPPLYIDACPRRRASPSHSRSCWWQCH